MFLNTVIDASTFGYHDGTFWPGQTLTQEAHNGNEPTPMAKFDSTLTLSYFRHSEMRKKSAQWLNIVGLSGILYAITYYPCEDVEPNVLENPKYYADIIKRLRASLSRATPSPTMTRIEGDPYVGMLPVYFESQICLYEFNSLHYCYDAINRATEYPGFSGLHTELQGLKDMIPEGRRVAPNISQSVYGVGVPLTSGPPQVDGAGDDIV